MAWLLLDHGAEIKVSTRTDMHGNSICWSAIHEACRVCPGMLDTFWMGPLCFLAHLVSLTPCPCGWWCLDGISLCPGVSDGASHSSSRLGQTTGFVVALFFVVPNPLLPPAQV